jgi:hypothetical protein
VPLSRGAIAPPVPEVISHSKGPCRNLGAPVAAVTGGTARHPSSSPPRSCPRCIPWAGRCLCGTDGGAHTVWPRWCWRRIARWLRASRRAFQSNPRPHSLRQWSGLDHCDQLLNQTRVTARRAASNHRRVNGQPLALKVFCLGSPGRSSRVRVKPRTCNIAGVRCDPAGVVR